MTKAARMVLDDCRIALSMLEEETDLSRWRVHWAAAMVLARAVGHVLKKVDGSNSVIERAADEAHERWKGDIIEHEIFREFIDKERNNIIKEYRFNIHPSEEVSVIVATAVMDVATGSVQEINQVYPLGFNIYRPILDGYREGDDARDVLKDAIDWWERELGCIDAAVTR